MTLSREDTSMTSAAEESFLPVTLRRSHSQEIKMPSSEKDDNVFLSYVCLVNSLSPFDSRAGFENGHLLVGSEPEQKEQEPIQVERSKAHHNLELKEHAKKTQKETQNKPTTSECEDDYDSDDLDFQNFIGFDNPNVLNITRMKWLTDGFDNRPDASSPSLSQSSSDSAVSQDSVVDAIDSTDKHLSTILSIDKEHNLFGLSAMASMVKKPHKASGGRKERAVFHQTAIVQVSCDPSDCSTSCCKFRSKTDLPCSLKCNSCRSCTSCGDPCGPCGPPCGPPCAFCSTCSVTPCKFRSVGLTPFKIHDDHEVNEVELTPRSSCVQQLPLSARTCNHKPRCYPPSACFPFLMPCYWPSRPSAPCADPRTCFHVPPCLPPRKPVSLKDPTTMCPPGGKCTDARTTPPCGQKKSQKVSQCINPTCPGNIPGYKDAILTKYSKQIKKC